ncbi:sensor histidine kinase [Tahibacter harae]|uniref:histidine kinase n=1 Tax=Tahibacter harae TaxID=2963937 RepID=A0ABT1QY21_9GAMM|nr:HAMP domain-containing sensor histidine kinase [Tahibacter harae]MCQ4167190.1 HAMP domain-containing histidine kinase [Tahibacter harae]
MRAPLPLRRRVALAYATLGLLLSLAFAAATLYLTEDYEHIVVSEILSAQAQEYADEAGAGAMPELPHTPRLRGYLRRADGGGLPPALAGLGPGIHEMESAAAPGRHAGVFDTPAGRLVFLIDLDSIEELEKHLAWFCLLVVLLGTGLSGWAGWLLAGRTIAPVKQLAAAVDALPARPQATNLAGLAGRDELGRLARAIDAYQARLLDADAAERAFFADASHELRTPIAVVQGAAEVLLDDPDAAPAQRRRLARLERGLNELTDLINLLLGLARRSNYTAQPVDAAELLQECAAQLRAGTESTALALHIEAAGSLFLPRAEALLALRSILRRLLPPAAQGELQLQAGAGRIRFDYRAGTAATAPAAAPARSDRGIGLTLIGRFADHLGWKLEEHFADNGYRAVEIEIPERISGMD